ncbi:C6 transcription factor, putative [Cordyceps militaris CM01]|uniref:C6 transcription factor, putative n=1 Tax=Cordyceps militaris (strain CM01) TaxID=983644 RepID=G3JBY4_CORMM|nr:C6 transcription factor, putative [Cordyceps militaris CM01]EGX93702.1 C6 transcription factor, putative [Cordyceps militaris CM01]
MSAADASWKVHLRGAAHIVHAMYSPGGLAAAGETGPALTLGNDSLSIRRFLVSLLSYLDVAASCATGEAPLIAGDYWETLGGGWQYNLGVPDFAATQCASNRDLAQVRSAWSRLMSVQAEISDFAKLQRSGLDEQQRDAIKAELVYRLRNWHESAPNVFSKLENLDAIPDDATDDEREMLTVTACVGSYALACTIYLERVATKSIKSAAYDGEIKSAVDRVLTLTLNFSHGIHQLAVVWPLLTAGIATSDRHKQELCRQKLSGMNVFGFKVR